MLPDPAAFVDTDRYPVDQPGAARDALVAHLHAELATDGCAVLKGSESLGRASSTPNEALGEAGAGALCADALSLAPNRSARGAFVAPDLAAELRLLSAVRRATRSWRDASRSFAGAGASAANGAPAADGAPADCAAAAGGGGAEAGGLIFAIICVGDDGVRKRGAISSPASTTAAKPPYAAGRRHA